VLANSRGGSRTAQEDELTAINGLPVTEFSLEPDSANAQQEERNTFEAEKRGSQTLQGKVKMRSTDLSRIERIKN